MLLRPRQTKFRKLFKGKIKGVEQKAINLQFGSYGLKALEIGRISAKQIEAARRTITRKLRRAGKVYVRIFPSVPVTSKPIEVRMGKGKGAVDYWVAPVKPGRILFEIGGLNSPLCIAALKNASHKLSIATTIIEKK